MDRRKLMQQMFSMTHQFSRMTEVKGFLLMPKSEFKLVNVLIRHHKESNDWLTAREAADCLHLSSPAISRTVKSLVVKGWVEQIEDQADRRTSFLKITELGFKHYNLTLEQIDNIMRLLFDEFTEEELLDFIQSGDRLAKVMDKIMKESED